MFQPGDKVSVLYESGVYTVLEFGNLECKLEDEHGFEVLVKRELLVARRSMDVKKVVVKENETAPRKKVVSKASSIPEIDLHLSALFSLAIPEKSEALLHQLAAFKRFTNEMIRQRQTKFRVIHGAGEGKLRAEIRQLVQGKNGLTIHDAQYANGSIGASIVEVQLSKVDYF